MNKLLTVILCFFCFSAFTQQPNDVINGHNFNKLYAEHLLKLQIDSIRQTHGVSALANDSILYLAADFHVDYLLINNKLSHNQYDNEDTKTPQQRAEKFGAKNYIVGENVARTYIHKRLSREKKDHYTITTYQQLARALARDWVESEKHFENMLRSDYEVTGIALAIDTGRMAIKAVQKFAEVKFKYIFNESKAMFPYSDYQAPKQVQTFEQVPPSGQKTKYPFRLKRPKDSTEVCNYCNTVIDTAQYKNKLYLRGSRVIFSTPNIEMMYEILNHRKNGLVLEIVAYEPVDCGNPEFYTMPSRRNKQSLLNGIVLKPLYRKDLIKGFKRGRYKWFYRLKKKGEPTHFEISLGKLPRDIGGYVEMNVLILQKKQICRVMHFTDICGDKIKRFFDVPYLSELKKYNYGINPGKRQISFTIPFKQGKYQYDYSDIKPLIDSVTSESFTIESAIIKAYSSLEGSKEINEVLQQKRARNIIRAMEENQHSKIDATIETNANWELFEKQITDNYALKDLRGLSREGILEKLSDKAYVKRIEKFLAEQRYGKVTLSVRVDITEQGVGNFLINEFQRMKDSIIHELSNAGMTRMVKARLDTLAGIQWYTYHLIKSGKVDSTLFEELTVPVNLDYAQIIKDHLWYAMDLGAEQHGDMRWERDFYRQLQRLDQLGISSFEIRFDVMNYLLKNWYKRLPYRGDVNKLKDNISALEQLAKTPEQKQLSTQLMINYHIANANRTHFSNRTGDDPDQMRNAMEAVFNYFLSVNYSIEDLYSIASFFTWGEQEDLAYALLEANIDWNDPYPPALALYSRIRFSHHEEYPEEDYVQYLTDIKEKMSPGDWCGLFIGPCNISFQVFDDEGLRKIYCETCDTYPNYAKYPELYNTKKNKD